MPLATTVGPESHLLLLGTAGERNSGQNSQAADERDDRAATESEQGCVGSPDYGSRRAADVEGAERRQERTYPNPTFGALPPLENCGHDQQQWNERPQPERPTDDAIW